MYNLLTKEYTCNVSLSRIIKNPHSVGQTSYMCLFGEEYISRSHFYGDVTKVFILHIKLERQFPYIPSLLLYSLLVQNIKIC